MCQSCDVVQIKLILRNDEPWSMEATGELDGEPIKILAAVHEPSTIAESLNSIGRLLDRQRLSWDFE